MPLRLLRTMLLGRRYGGALPQAGGRLPEEARAFLRRLPKAEIHLHFEGAIGVEAILRLARKHGVHSIRTRADAEWRLFFSKPQEFFQQFLFVSNLLRDFDDFRDAARDLGLYFITENIRYAEITFAPHKFITAGLAYPALLEAMDLGFEDAQMESETGFDYRYIIDVVRDLGAEAGMRVMREVEAHPHPKTVGIGLGGGENYPAKDSKAVFDFAASLGLRKTAHAGEGLGPKSIWETLEHLEVERIDHGVRAREDAKLVEHLRQRRIPLNLCPTSNVMLGVTRSLEDHPIRTYFEQGLSVNVSTDDPAFFRSTLTEEFSKLIVYQGFTPGEIPILIENALQASFLEEETKASLIEDFQRETRALARALSIRLATVP